MKIFLKKLGEVAIFNVFFFQNAFFEKLPLIGLLVGFSFLHFHFFLKLDILMAKDRKGKENNYCFQYLELLLVADSNMNM